MSTKRFQVLFAELYPHVFKNDTRIRNTVQVDKEDAGTCIICQLKAVRRKLSINLVCEKQCLNYY